MKIAAIMMTMVFSRALMAGWVSAGGGELFKDAHNPWFLKNVTSVNYCIQVSSTSVSTSIANARAAIDQALQYWKSEFKKVSVGAGNGKFALGTQTFTEVPCSQTQVSVRFLIGYDTLTIDQIQFLVEPTNFIGVAVRTDYDKDLIGKGFIFIASDQGPNAYHGGTDATLISQAWSHPALLKYAILHELGHVFGLPHTGTGLMSETFLEQILSKNLADAFERIPAESFFAPDDELDFCGPQSVSSRALSWLEAPNGDFCVHLSRQGGGWQVSSRKDQSVPAPGVKIGNLLAPIPDLSDYRPRPAIVLQLMGNTTLFTTQETMFRPFMFGPMLIDQGMKGNYVPLKGVTKPAYVKISPEALLVQGTVGSKIENILSYSSPIGILLLQDPTPP